jgi:hypothetical protein
MRNILLLYTLLFTSTFADKIIPLDIGILSDDRLAKINKQDIIEMISEANRILKEKLNAPIQLKTSSITEKPLKSLFKGQNNASKIYLEGKKKKIPFKISEKEFFNLSNKHKESTLKFMKQWKLSSFKSYFPKEKISSYGDAWKLLMKTYFDKLQFLKSLKTKNGEQLLNLKGLPEQSNFEWMWAVDSQENYDLIITNGLIVADVIDKPYLHAVMKHAKIGGSGFTSYKRRNIEGYSMMVNTIEFFGNIKGISTENKSLTRSFKNKAVGGFFIAHEFAHIFYYIPDQYEHGSHCLMNSAYEDMDYVEGYNKLISQTKLCKKCKPWVDHKHKIMEMSNTKIQKKKSLEYIKKALVLIKKTPKHLSTHRDTYLSNFLNRVISNTWDYLQKRTEVYFYCLKFANENNIKRVVQQNLKNIKMSEEAFLKICKQFEGYDISDL